MIELLLPAGIASANTRADEGWDALLPDERRYIDRAVAKRKVEFAAVRVCARQALAALGVAQCSLVPGRRGAVPWPAEVVGSMTHCDGYRAAAVGLRKSYAAIGIDAEPASKLPQDVLEAIALREELSELKRLDASNPHLPWCKLLFSAKESIYKAWYPYSGDSLGFEDVHVFLDETTHCFNANLVDPSRVLSDRFAQLHGSWQCVDGYVATAVVLEEIHDALDR